MPWRWRWSSTATEELLANYSWHRDIVETVDKISKQYRRLEQYEKADQLYQYVLDTWPDPASGLWAQTQSAISHIRAGSIEDADEAVAKLFTDYSDSSELGKCLNEIARSYVRADEYARAFELYNHVIANCPSWQRQVAMWAHQGVAICNIGLGNDEQATAAVANLIVDFSDVWNVGAAAFLVGEQYWNLGLAERRQSGSRGELNDKAVDYFSKALSVWERTITELPPSADTARSYQFAGECCVVLADYEQAIEHFQKLLNNWPDYEHAWHIYYMIGRIYTSLKKSGVIPESEADTKIKAAFEQIVNNYPDCPPANAARGWLEHNAKTKEGEQK